VLHVRHLSRGPVAPVTVEASDEGAFARGELPRGSPHACSQLGETKIQSRPSSPFVSRLPVIDPALRELLRLSSILERIARVMADRQPVLVQAEDYLKVCDRRTAQSQPPGHQPSGRARRFHSSTLVPLLPNRA